MSVNKNMLLGVLKELSLLTLLLLVGGIVWFCWYFWGASIAPFDDPYLSGVEYQRLIDKENQLITVGMWVGKAYIIGVLALFAVRVVKRFRSS
ncbi:MULTISPECIES: hypothetical protein [unclassified Vibrio]|uniref:hypothetical protein n=1 Tax=unclassified Vibrio TaxID=2614977 RepID=UPI002552638A|nr:MULTISPECIES: hypothetical protein [unclassified Vibrio]